MLRRAIVFSVSNYLSVVDLSQSHPKPMLHNNLRDPFYMRDVHSQCIGVNADARVGPGYIQFLQ